MATELIALAELTLEEQLELLRRKRQRKRRDLDRFGTLEATPHDFGNIAASSSSATDLTMPSSARLAVSHSVALLEGGVTVSVGGLQDFTHPALAADVVHRGHHIERNRVVEIQRGTAIDAPAGTLTLYYVDAFGRHVAIGTATFT